MDNLNILMIGDVVGKPGMEAVKNLLPRIISRHKVDFTIANGENAAGGLGITPALASSLFEYGVDVITSGNHIWRKKEIRPFIEEEPRLLRPANFPDCQPGKGYGIFETPSAIKIGVINLSGRIYMDPADNPFEAADRVLKLLKNAGVILVDFHAEATSEKRAMGFFLAGRVQAVVGTHTHVLTADNQILEDTTAYITDLGMTGPHDSVIGNRKDLIVNKFVTGMPHSFKLAKKNVRLQGVVINLDVNSKKALSIERIDIEQS